jgi:Ankyrin repeat
LLTSASSDSRPANSVRRLLHERVFGPARKNGSTPLHLAVQNTGRSDSGSAAAKDEQGRVIAVLLEHGARPTDADANGKTVAAAASSDRIRALLGIP